MTKILILDCGIGNLASINASLRKVDADPKIVPSLRNEESFKGVIIPGVGNYSAAFKKIDEERTLLERIVKEGCPVLGICLGLQLMFEWSEEGNPEERGLGFFKGVVRKIPEKHLPHIGWNTIEIVGDSMLLKGLSGDARVYFVHSYAPFGYDAEEAVAFTRYGGSRFPVVFEKNNLFGTQFHPEKSWEPGLRILRNFVETCEEWKG
ncbi:MAG: imidazole glycerol phosphate synthase subunit HisH [Thermoproteota archaeon]